MKKNLILLVLAVLTLGLVLGACKKSPQLESQVAVPIVGQADPSTEKENTYPIEESSIENEPKTNVAGMYPVQEGNPNFDADMEAWVKELFGSQHTVDFVLSHKKTAEEWRAHFNTPAHEHLELTEKQLEVLVGWLVDRTK